MARTSFTVTELNAHIKQLLDADVLLGNVCVTGELSNYKVYPSGHHYFTLKDAESSLRCVMFRSSAQSLRFRPASGMSVAAIGRIAVYPRDGAYQLYCTRLIPGGVGDLYAAYEQLKEQLQKEGLFDRAHKKPLPLFPQRIAVITSAAGAAVRDIIRVLGKRWPASEVVLLPVRVQGTEAPAEIAGAIRYANRYRVGDLIITGRGGGSIEDLWAFNEEQVAWAIFNAETPIITATGHEIDTTVADMVADKRESNPSTAVMHVLPVVKETVSEFEQRYLYIKALMDNRMEKYRRNLDGYARQLRLLSPEAQLGAQREKLDRLQETMKSLMSARLSSAHDRCERMSERLEGGMYRKYELRLNALAVMTERLHGLSPPAKLVNGFGYIASADQPVTSVGDVEPGSDIEITVHDGKILASVTDINGFR